MSDTNSDNYLSISAFSEGLYKDSGSRFLSLAYPCPSVDWAMEKIAELRKKYYDATHVCYAYRIGPKGEQYRINDDGEPSSTAGRPIYGEILSANLSDILVVVVRWFGGVKLGVPGLIKAYKSAAKEALINSTTITKTATIPKKILFNYPETDKILKELRKYNIEPYEKQFLEVCSMKANLPQSLAEQICNTLRKVEGVEIEDCS